MLLSAGAIYGLTASPAFGLGPVSVRGLHFTDAAQVNRSLDLTDGANLFSLSTEPLAARLRELPTVAAADVTVQLPDTLDVQIHERSPILVWAVGDQRFLVDRDGVLFAPAVDGSSDGGQFPAMSDRRAASASLALGSRLDPIDLDAATRLGSLRPADVGSAAAMLSVAVSDENGFVVTAAPNGWSAIFGFYTPSLRTPDLIPGQVRLLRSLLSGREPTVERVILASDTSGTYIPRSSPRPSPSPRK